MFRGSVLTAGCSSEFLTSKIEIKPSGFFSYMHLPSLAQAGTGPRGKRRALIKTDWRTSLLKSIGPSKKKFRVRSLSRLSFSVIENLNSVRI